MQKSTYVDLTSDLGHLCPTQTQFRKKSFLFQILRKAEIIPLFGQPHLTKLMQQSSVSSRSVLR